MPKYKVLEKSLIGNQIYEAGEIAEYDGLPSENLEALDDEGRAKKEEYEASNQVRVQRLIEQNPSGVGDPAAFLAAFVKIQAEASATQAQQIADAVAQAISALLPNGIPVKGNVKLPEPTAADTDSTFVGKGADQSTDQKS